MNVRTLWNYCVTKLNNFYLTVCKKWVIYFIVLAIGFISGFITSDTYCKSTETITKTEKVEVPIIQEKVITQTKTEIAYIPKEINPITKLKEETDVQVGISQPNVNVKVNGSDYKFQLGQYEKQKFDNGKLVLNQSSEIKLDIKTTNPKLLNVSAFYGDGYGLSVGYKKLSLDIDFKDNGKPKIDRFRYNIISF